MKFDLHTHSTFSDGRLTPFELIERIKRIGFSGFSITDHDTVDAYSFEVMQYAKASEVVLIPGVEFSAYHHDTSIHILGYGYDVDSSVIRSFCNLHKKRRLDRNAAILKALEKEGMTITLEELYQGSPNSIGRPHIGELMRKKGYVSSLQEAFDLWIGDKKPCFVKGSIFGVEETISTIHRSGGKAVLAHPILIKKRSVIRSIAMSFDGLECYYARFPDDKSKEMLRLAEKYDLIPTGGSDFHDETRHLNALGSSFTTLEHLEELLGRKMQ